MDYFDALLRAAGLASGGAATAATAEPRAAAPDLIELSDEVEVPSAPAVHVQARAALPDTNGAPVDAPAAAAAAPTPTAEARAPDPIGEQPLRAAARAPGPTRRHEPAQATAGVHPLVQAALHWVAAGSTVADQPQAAAPQLPSVIEIAPKTLPMQAARVSVPPHATALEAAAQNAVPEKRQDGRAVTQTVATAPLQRAAEAGPMRPPRRPGTASVATHLPEVHIGAIHLTVDAPRPPAPPPVPAPPAPPQPAARSAFLRSRAPRL